MLTRYAFDIIENFSDGLVDALRFNHETSPMDSIIQVILQNNGCAFSDTCEYYSFNIMNDDSYYIDYIYGARANDANEYFDYIELNGTRRLVIFLDYFYGLLHKPEPKDEVDKQAQEFMGNSTYFDAISKLTSIFLDTIYAPAVFTNALAASAAGQYVRKIPQIVAAKVIYMLTGKLTENDVGGFMPYDELFKFATDYREFRFASYGIFVRE